MNKQKVIEHDRETVDYIICGKTFPIRDCPLGVSQGYTNLIVLLAKINEISNELKKIVDKTEKKILLTEQEEKKGMELAKSISSDFNVNYFDQLLGLLQLILKINGIKYDKKWWSEWTTKTDLMDFISIVCTCDGIEQEKKRKRLEIATNHRISIMKDCITPLTDSIIPVT